MRCDECRFYAPMPAWTNLPGDCRRNPPVVAEVKGELTGVWPDMAVDGWCGEFVQRDFEPGESPVDLLGKS